MDLQGVVGQRPTWIEVDLDRIGANVAALRRALSSATGGASAATASGTATSTSTGAVSAAAQATPTAAGGAGSGSGSATPQLMAIVKADAYGHGAVEVARTVLEHGASWLGVAIPAEGVALRQAGISAPILVLGACWPEEAQTYITSDLRATVTDLSEAQALSEAAVRLGPQARARVHIKVDTGMGRIGVSPQRAVAFAQEVARLPQVEIEGVFSHLATADEGDTTGTHQQIERFARVCTGLKQAGLTGLIRHLANTAALLRFPEAAFDMVRAGIGIYGYYPSPTMERTVPLRPALRWLARVVFVKRVGPGTPISYGWTYVTRKATTIATIPVGYADGYRRELSNRGQVICQRRRCSVVGRVCMDQLMVDVGDLPVAIGDPVILLGDGLDADRWAEWLRTISYEVLTGISPRVPRVYVHGAAASSLHPTSSHF